MTAEDCSEAMDKDKTIRWYDRIIQTFLAFTIPALVGLGAFFIEVVMLGNSIAKGLAWSFLFTAGTAIYLTFLIANDLNSSYGDENQEQDKPVEVK